MRNANDSNGAESRKRRRESVSDELEHNHLEPRIQPTVEPPPCTKVEEGFLGTWWTEAQPSRRASSESLGLLDTTIWPDVNGREQLELLAGHHRIRALEEWMKLAKLGEKELWWPCKFFAKLGEKELWWPCKFYDRGKLA
ncbi:hypothetical protein E4U15_004999 [Claviceps sp. LM218 group G6]|nr:hypothetical protein E4U15_004999 [Claviceps sp. LM218 group G6]